MNTFMVNDKQVVLKSIDNTFLNNFDELKYLLFFKNYFNDKKINIIDCGGNIGSYSIFFSLFLNCNKIYCIEPITNIFNILNENIKINKCNNIETMNIGIARKKSEIKLISEIPNNKGAFWFWYTDSSDSEIELQKPYNIGYKEHKTIDDSSIISKCDSIDNIFSDKDSIDFIKIDVEGMEIEALIGAENIINKNKPLLYVEGSLKTMDCINDWINKNNYTRIETGLFKKHHFLLKYGHQNDNSSNR
jgi:FkbM family methyltransferase